MWRARHSVQYKNHRRGTNSRRLSFFDVHETRNEVAMLEEKLLRATGNLKAYEDKEAMLLQSISDLQSKYDRLLQGSMFALWEYCPTKSADFRFIPQCDHTLEENDKEIGDYIVHSTLGSGHSSVVFCCFRNRGNESESNNVRNGGAVALKTLEKSELVSLEDLFKVEREVKALSLLSPHQNIVRYYNTLHGKQRIYILMECYPTDLFNFIGKFKKKLNPNVVAHITNEILMGLEHLAANTICHRDLKPENILIYMDKNNFSLKLCDFGLCSILPDLSTPLTNFRGSPGFFAPECLLQSSYCGFTADLFSVGCITLEMLVTHRFFNNNWMSQYEGLQTTEAPAFSDSMIRGLQAVHAEIGRKYGPSVAEKTRGNVKSQLPRARYGSKGNDLHHRNEHHTSTETPDKSKITSSITDFMRAVLNFQPHLRPSVEDALQNKWIRSSNKLQLLDTLHNRDETAYIQIPKITPTSLRYRGTGVTTHDIDDDDAALSRTRTTSICEGTLKQQDSIIAPASRDYSTSVVGTMVVPIRDSDPSAETYINDNAKEIEALPANGDEVSLPTIVDQPMKDHQDKGSQHFEPFSEEKQSAEHGNLSSSNDRNNFSTDHDQILEMPIVMPVGVPSPDFSKLCHSDQLDEKMHIVLDTMGEPLVAIRSEKSTPFGSPHESPITSNTASRSSTPTLQILSNNTLESEGLPSNLSMEISAGQNSGILDIFRKYKDDQEETPIEESGRDDQMIVIRTRRELANESLSDKMSDINSLMRQIEDRAIFTAQVIQDTLSPEKGPQDDEDPRAQDTEAKLSTQTECEKLCMETNVLKSPKCTSSRKKLSTPTKRSSPSDDDAENPLEEASNGKSPYLTTKPHHTYSPHNFYVSKGTSGKLVI